MKLIQGTLRSLNIGLSRQSQWPHLIRAFSTGSSNIPNTNSFESGDEFEQRILGDSTGNSPNLGSFYRKLVNAEQAHKRFGMGSKFNIGNKSEFMEDDGLDESFNTLSDGMDGKLKAAATDSNFDIDYEELYQEDYAYRPDMSFPPPGGKYDTEDLNIRKPGVSKPIKRNEFKVTTEEVLRKADFRNVRFLANFITRAGIIIKRSQTKISAKAQRKVAREIKTARAFGLMPFTTMGTKYFAFGKTMENLEEDYEYETFDRNFVEDDDPSQDPL